MPKTCSQDEQKTEFAHDCDTKYLTFTFGRKIVWWENDIRKCHISAHARQSKNNLPSAKLSFVIVAEPSRRQKPIIIECVIFTWTEELTAPTSIVILKYFRFSLKLIKLCIITQLTMTAMTKIVTLFEIQLSVRIIGNTKLCSTQFNIWLNELIDCDRSQKCIRVITYLAKNWFSHFTGITLEFITGGWNV